MTDWDSFDGLDEATRRRLRILGIKPLRDIDSFIIRHNTEPLPSPFERPPRDERLNPYLIKEKEPIYDLKEILPREETEPPKIKDYMPDWIINNLNSKIIVPKEDTPCERHPCEDGKPVYTLGDNLQLVAQDLCPFLYDSTQDAKVVETALRVVRDPRFIQLEARALARRVHAIRPIIPAQRYEDVVVPALADTMASFAYLTGITRISGSAPVSLESIEAVKEQIDRVNFCPKQIRGIIEYGKVRNAYIDGVSARLSRAGLI